MGKIELPDFDEMFVLVEEIGQLSKRSMELELDIQIREARLTLTVTNDKIFFINGKSPSQSYIDSSWKVVGLNGELVPLREELVDTKWRLELSKNRLELLKKRVEIWRTQSANERTAVV